MMGLYSCLYSFNLGFIGVYIYIYKYIYIYIYICIYIYTFIYIFVFVSTSRFMYGCNHPSASTLSLALLVFFRVYLQHWDDQITNFGLCFGGCYMGLSENSVPLNPMVNDHYPY